MQATIIIETTVLGAKRPALPDWSLPVAAPPETLRLRDLVTQVVHAEVAAFRERQTARRTVHVLTEADLQWGLERGKVDSGGRDLGQEVDAETAAITALQAFVDGRYLVFVDSQQITDLDAPVQLHPASRLRFVRLTPLAGG